MKKRFITLLLTLALLVNVLPVGAMAADTQPPEDSEGLELELRILPDELLNYEIQEDHVIITGADFTKDYNAIVIPEEIDGYPVTEVGDDAFKGIKGLSVLVFPDSVTKIGIRTCTVCSQLQAVRLPAYLEEIPTDMFLYCEMLQIVKMPETLTTIGWTAFSQCTSLTHVELPDSVTTICPDAFSGCESLESVFLPEGLTTIEQGAFKDCLSLKELDVPSTVTYMGDKAYGTNCYGDSYPDCVLYGYAGSDVVRYARESNVPLYIYNFEDDDQTGSWTWATDSVYNCVGAGLINGYPGNLFCPDKAVARIELVSMMYRLYQELELDLGDIMDQHPFTDATGAWYQDALNWAYTTGVVTGTSATTFDPFAPIQRQDLATILYRFLDTFYLMEPVTTNQLAQFQDADTVASYARIAMEFCVAEGILNGVGGGRVAPRETATRAQAACILDRAFIA